MITFKKAHMVVYEQNLNMNESKYPAEEICEQIRKADARLSKRLTEARRNQKRSWENAMWRNYGL